MDSKNIIIVILIVAIVAVCSLFAGMYIAGGQDDYDGDDGVAVNNTTEEENETVEAVENTQSQDTSSSSDSGNYVTADDGNTIDLSGTHRIWSEQDGSYVYVDDEGYYKDGYIISEDENGNINAIKDTRGDE